MKTAFGSLYPVIGLAMICTFLAGCVTTPSPAPKIAQTVSGRPEVVIQGDLKAVQTAIIGKMRYHNYKVEQQNDNLIRMSRPLQPNESVSASRLAGRNLYDSSLSRRVTTFTIAKPADIAGIVVSSKIVAQGPDYQVYQVEVADTDDIFNEIQSDLYAIKSEVENLGKHTGIPYWPRPLGTNFSMTLQRHPAY
ncbi:MAG: hypothetical protein WCR49_11585 [Opitutae bacterium]